MESVDLSCKITKIGERLFQNCSSLTNINIPDTVESIGLFSFKGCSSLSSVVITEKVTSINASAFNECGNLKSVYFFADLSKFSNTAFLSKMPASTFYAPSNKTNEYNTLTNSETFKPFDTWTWDDTAKTAMVKFADGDDSYAADVSLSSNVPATYSADGSASYTASYTYNGRSFTNTKNFVIPKLTMFIQLYTSTDSSGDIGVKLYVPIPDNAESAEGYSVKFGKKAPVELKECPTAIGTDGRKYYLVKFTAPAKNMNDEYEYSVLFNNEVLANGSASVRSYAETVINGSYSDKTKKLCRAMLAYGGAAQKLFGYNTDNLADNGISGEGADYSGAVLPTAEPLNKASLNNALKDAPIEYYGMNLNIDSDTFIKLAFKVKNGYALTDAVSYINNNIRIDGAATKAKGNLDKDNNVNENFVIVRSNPIAINNLMKDISLNIDGNEFTVNVKQYMTLASLASVDEKLVNVCKALYNYYIAANNQ